MQISSTGINLIKQFEGCKLTAYPDPGTGGAPWTIGYGWTHPVDGKPVVRGMTIDQPTADRLLKCGVVQFEQGVNQMLKIGVTQNQFDALVSLAYNIGTRALSTSTLMKKVNAGDAKGAADEFLKWNKAGGKEMKGLTNRRAAERELFLS
ncbi:muraminidase [Yersinia entomophaga]|uniref:Lysozyme n=1 Tax=Yersinia entomophaga TaxID=935293 RepID=A0ABM6BIT5_YERET|nr:lysozyme [Yersinia entomophaga]ANI29459.1 muraminidase [Yersinia entomophaga]ANI31953.1 muraminidase [Yersinia entomophaga]OWF84937.1 muraminidase [Yersinia entomophaga]